MVDLEMAPPPDIPPISFENYSHQSTTLVDDLLPAWSRDQSPLDTQRQSSFPTTTPFPEEIPAPLSFANVASIPSLSPKALSTTPIQSPPLPAHTAIATGTPRSPIITSEQMQNPTNDFAGELTEGLHRRETVGEDAVLNDGRIQAFAKLEFEHFDIYIQKLNVVLGRRPAAVPMRKQSIVSQDSYKLEGFRNATPPIKQEESVTDLALSGSPSTMPLSAPSPSFKGKEKVMPDPLSEFVKSSPVLAASSSLVPDQDVPEISLQAPDDASAPVASTSQTKLEPTDPFIPRIQSTTDIDLGAVRAISRQHAKLFYDHELGGWILEVLGRNGVVIEGHWRGKGQKTLLLERTKIQIADRIFHFELPTIDVYRAEGEGIIESGSSTKTKGKGKGKGRGKGKGKSKTRRDGKGRIEQNGGESSSLSEVSDSELEHSPRQRPPLANGSVSLDASGFSPAASAPQTLSTDLPSLSTDQLPSPSLPPIPPRSSSLPISAASSAPPLRPSRSPLPRQASLRNSMAPPPRAASRNAVYNHAASSTSANAASRAPAPPIQVTAEDLEIGRQRAAMITQLLAGGNGASSGKAPAIVAQPIKRSGGMASRSSGRGKAVPNLPPPAGKAPGKGKGLPPRPSRSAIPGWGDGEDEDDSDGSSSSDEGEEDKVMAGAEGESLVRKTPVTNPALKAPSPHPPSHPNPSPRTTPLESPAPVASKQPKNRSSSIPISTSQPGNATSSLPPISLPPLPSSSASLPPLPTSMTSSLISPNLVSRPVPSPISTMASTPGTTSTSQAGTPGIHVPPVSAPSASTTALPLAPPSAYNSINGDATASTSSVTKKSKSKASKSNGDSTTKKKKSTKATPSIPVPPTMLPGTPTADSSATAPAKPRPTPYTPAPHPPDTPYPTSAPPDDPLAKPPFTYASLIAQALAESETAKLTMQQIYDWITSRWPYFKDHQSGWQNSIRHNLTPARGFFKVLRQNDEVGKGAFWMMDPAQAVNFDGLHFKRASSTSTSKSASSTTKAASPSKDSQSTTPILLSASPAPSSSTTSKSANPPKAKASSNKAAASTNSTLSKPLPIVVGPIPDSYVRPAPPKAALDKANDEVTAALLADPPIVLHEGKIILNPGIFAHLKKEQLSNLEAIPASKALQILQAFVVQHFKDKMRKAAAEKARAAAALTATSGGGGGGAGVTGTATTNGTLSSTLSSAPETTTAPSSSSSSKPTTSKAAPAPTPTASSSSAVPKTASKSTKTRTKKRERESSDIATTSSEPLSKIAKT